MHYNAVQGEVETSASQVLTEMEGDLYQRVLTNYILQLVSLVYIALLQYESPTLQLFSEGTSH